MDAALRRPVADALPDGTTFAFRGGDERTWMRVIGDGDTSYASLTRQVLNTALASINRPAR